MKMCEQILCEMCEKTARPNTTKILSIVKAKRSPIRAPAIALRLLKTEVIFKRKC